MSYRCVNAFAFEERVYSGGCEVADDDQILSTHAEHFVRVDEPATAAATETVTAEPGVPRGLSKRGRPRKHAEPRVEPEQEPEPEPVEDKPAE